MARKRKRTQSPRQRSEPRISSDPHPANQGSASSSAVDLPGFVYDPIRRKYFRRSDAPDNNFTVPVSKLIVTPEKLPPLWIRKGILRPSSDVRIFRAADMSRRGGLYGFRRILIAHCHDYVKTLGRTILTFDLPEQFGKPHSAFDLVDGSLDGDSPRFVYAFRNKGTCSRHMKGGCVNLSMGPRENADGGILQPTRLALWSEPPYKVNREGAQICSLAVLSSNLLFMSCRTDHGQYGGTDVLVNTNLNYEALLNNRRIEPHDICAASVRDSTIVTASTVSGEVRVYLLSETRAQTFVIDLDNHLRDEVFSSCVEVVPAKPHILIGTTSGRILQVDHGQGNLQTLVGADVWKNIGVEGICRVTAVKCCKGGKGLLTVVAGLPEDVPKMHLWDLRKLDRPLVHFDGSCYQYSRYRHRLNISSDDSLVVCSDNQGTTRFWDLDSGCLLAEIGRRDHDSTPPGRNPPVAFYSDNFGGRGEKALVLASLGRRPSVVLHNIWAQEKFT